jgi:hypothetical protein
MPFRNIIILLRNTVFERMGNNRKLFWRLIAPVVFWGVLILLLFFLLPPVPKEPEGLPPQTWSYYGSQAPPQTQLLKYRNELLMLIVSCAIVSEFVAFYFKKGKLEG